MINLTASAIVTTIVNTASDLGYRCTLQDEFTDVEYTVAAQLASALLDAMTERLDIQCNPGEIRCLAISVVNSNGDTLRHEDIDTSEIPGYGDGIAYSYGRLYRTVAYVATAVLVASGSEFIIRLAIETLPGTDDIEVIALIARDGNGPVYRIEEVHMMQG